MSRLSPKRLAKFFGSLPTNLIALASGGAIGGLAAVRMLSALKEMSAEDMGKFTKKFLPVLMSFSGREMNPDNMDQYACVDCEREFMPMFMLRDELWWTVLTQDERPRQFDMGTKEALCMEHEDHQRVAVCLCCCSKRLGRPLHPDDLSPKYMTSSMLADASSAMTPCLPEPEVLAG
jgi:hypothetical protein